MQHISNATSHNFLIVISDKLKVSTCISLPNSSKTCKYESSPTFSFFNINSSGFRNGVDTGGLVEMERTAVFTKSLSLQEDIGKD